MNQMTPSPLTPSPVVAAGLADPRSAFHRVAEVAVTTVAAVTPDQLDLPTPCDAFAVRELLRHLHMAIARTAALPTAPTPAALPVEDHTIADGEWADAVARAAADVRRAWADDRVLTREVDLPWMTAPGADVLSLYASEVVVHTWDLARATGQRPVWEDDDVELALAAMRRELPDAERAPMWAEVRASLPPATASARPWADPFADAVEVGAGATPVERLVAWCGRRV